MATQIQPAAARKIDGLKLESKRLARAKQLRVVPGVSAGTFMVEGGSQPHVVNLNALVGTRDLICDCMDARYAGKTGNACKHVIAALIAKIESQPTTQPAAPAAAA